VIDGLSVSLVIPTRNQAVTLRQLLPTVPSLIDEVVIVDGGSTDGTLDIARSHGARAITETRRGYGRAFKTGFNSAKGDLLVSADADGIYSLGVLQDLLKALLARELSFVSGARFPLADPTSMRSRNRLGNRVITAACSLVSGRTFQDALSNMWAMRREAWVELDVVSDSRNFVEEIKLRAAEQFGAGFAELHIQYAERRGNRSLVPLWVGAENLLWLGLMRLGLERQAKAFWRAR
jgi:glycosyltransferase involved in cell wall biosynthesis